MPQHNISFSMQPGKSKGSPSSKRQLLKPLILKYQISQTGLHKLTIPYSAPLVQPLRLSQTTYLQTQSHQQPIGDYLPWRRPRKLHARSPAWCRVAQARPTKAIRALAPRQRHRHASGESRGWGKDSGGRCGGRGSNWWSDGFA